MADRLSLEGRLTNEREMSALHEQFIAVLGYDLRNRRFDQQWHLSDGKTTLNDRAKMINAIMDESITRMSELIERAVHRR